MRGTHRQRPAPRSLYTPSPEASSGLCALLHHISASRLPRAGFHRTPQAYRRFLPAGGATRPVPRRTIEITSENAHEKTVKNTGMNIAATTHVVGCFENAAHVRSDIPLVAPGQPPSLDRAFSWRGRELFPRLGVERQERHGRRRNFQPVWQLSASVVRSGAVCGRMWGTLVAPPPPQTGRSRHESVEPWTLPAKSRWRLVGTRTGLARSPLRPGRGKSPG